MGDSYSEYKIFASETPESLFQKYLAIRFNLFKHPGAGFFLMHSLLSHPAAV